MKIDIANFSKILYKPGIRKKDVKLLKNTHIQKSDDVPDLLNVTTDPNEDEVPTASSEELARLVNEGQDPLDYGEIPTVQQILSSTQLLESINVDEEAMQFFARSSTNDLWKRAFKEEEKLF